MASSGSGYSGSSGKGSYGSSANGNYASSARNGYAGSVKNSYGRLGVGYGIPKGIANRLSGYLSGLKGSCQDMPKLKESYLNKINPLLDVKDKYTVKQALKGLDSEKLGIFCEPDIYRHRISLDQRLKSCPYCGGDSLVCGCRN